MRIAMPSMPESVSYSIVAAAALAVVTALVLAAAGDLVAALLVLAVAIAIHWLVGRSLTTLVRASDAAAAIALLLVLCALADLVIGYPYEAVLFLLAAAALGFVFLLLQQGTQPAELRLGGIAAVAAQSGRVHLRMLEELRDAGILSSEEFAAKRHLVEP